MDIKKCKAIMSLFPEEVWIYLILAMVLYWVSTEYSNPIAYIAWLGAIAFGAFSIIKVILSIFE